MNFENVKNSYDYYSNRLVEIQEELKGLRETVLKLHLNLIEAESKAYEVATSDDEIRAYMFPGYIKAKTVQQNKNLLEAKKLLKDKEEEKDLTLEGLNILKARVRLFELESKINNDIT